MGPIHIYNLYENGIDHPMTGIIHTRKSSMDEYISYGLVVKEEIIRVKPLTTLRTVPPLDLIYIFDFDCTLTKRHFYYYMHELKKFNELYPDVSVDPGTYFDVWTVMSEYLNDRTDTIKDDIKYVLIALIFGTDERINAIRSLFERITKDKLYIASRGNKKHIIKMLELVDLGHLVKHDHITGGDVSKVNVLARNIPAHNIFYADDDHSEHEEFLKKYSSILIKDDEDETYVYYTLNYQDYPRNSYKFYKNLTKDIGGGLTIETINRLCHTVGGNNNYYKSYLKYKSKYLNLKNK